MRAPGPGRNYGYPEEMELPWRSVPPVASPRPAPLLGARPITASVLEVPTHWGWWCQRTSTRTYSSGGVVPTDSRAALTRDEWATHVGDLATYRRVCPA